MAAMTTLPRLSEESEESFDSYGSSKHSGGTMNFSHPQRPRGSSIQSHRSIRSSTHRSSSERNAPQGNVHSINAFHDSNRDFPDEPRFSIDSDSTTDPSDISAGSDAAWDGRRGQIRTKPKPIEKFDQQRFEFDRKPRRPEPRSSQSTRGSSERNVESPYHPIQTTISAGSSSDQAIMKRVSVDQQSERISLSADGREDTRSHHTISDDDASGSYDAEGNWQSSNHDTTGLTDAQIRKLLKKGVNPSLYAEMKAAKKGKGRWSVGPLLGNSFLG